MYILNPSRQRPHLLLEDFVRQRSVGVNVAVDGHPQAARHDCDEAAGAGTVDCVEVWRVWSRSGWVLSSLIVD